MKLIFLCNYPGNFQCFVKVRAVGRGLNMKVGIASRNLEFEGSGGRGSVRKANSVSAGVELYLAISTLDHVPGIGGVGHDEEV